jgi:hypothetical protein
MSEKEIVIRRLGASFGFSFPEGHRIAAIPSQDDDLIRLSVPDGRGETCRVKDKTEDAEEIRYLVEPTGTSSAVGEQPPGYPWPLIEDEQGRLVAEMRALTDPTYVDAWTRGESHEQHFARLRSLIRRLKQPWPRLNG